MPIVVAMHRLEFRCTAADIFGYAMPTAQVTLTAKHDASLSLALEANGTDCATFPYLQAAGEAVEWHLDCQMDGYAIETVVLASGRSLSPGELNEGFALGLQDWDWKGRSSAQETEVQSTDQHESPDVGAKPELNGDPGGDLACTGPLDLKISLSKFLFGVRVKDSVDPALVPDGATVRLVPCEAPTTDALLSPRAPSSTPRTGSASPRRSGLDKPNRKQQGKKSKRKKKTTRPGDERPSIELKVGDDLNQFSKEFLEKAEGWYDIEVSARNYEVAGILVNNGDVTEARRMGFGLSFGLWRAGVSVAFMEISLVFIPKPSLASFTLHEALPPLPSFDIALLLDATGSMGPPIRAARTAVEGLVKDLRRHYPAQRLRVAAVAYRDIEPELDIGEWGEPRAGESRDGKETPAFPVESLDFTEDLDKVAEFVQALVPKDGYDVPEDLLAGMEVLSRLDWTAAMRVAVVVTDAPCHGQHFHFLEDNFPYEDPHGLVPDEILARLSDQDVSLWFARLGSATDRMVKEFQKQIPLRVLDLCSPDEPAQVEDGLGDLMELRLPPVSHVNRSVVNETESWLASNLHRAVVEAFHEDLRVVVSIVPAVQEHPSQGAVALRAVELAQRHCWTTGGAWKVHENRKGTMEERNSILYAAHPTEMKVRATTADGLQTPFSAGFAFQYDLSSGKPVPVPEDEEGPEYRELDESSAESEGEEELGGSKSHDLGVESEKQSADNVVRTWVLEMGDFVEACETRLDSGRKLHRSPSFWVPGPKHNSRRLAFELAEGEYMVQATVVNSIRHCLAIELLTSTGRVKRFAGLSFQAPRSMPLEEAWRQACASNPGKLDASRESPPHNAASQVGVVQFVASEGTQIVGWHSHRHDDYSPRIVGAVLAPQPPPPPPTKSSSRTSTASSARAAFTESAASRNGKKEVRIRAGK